MINLPDPTEAKAKHFDKHCEQIDKELTNIRDAILAASDFPAEINGGISDGAVVAIRKAGYKTRTVPNGCLTSTFIMPIEDPWPTAKPIEGELFGEHVSFGCLYMWELDPDGDLEFDDAGHIRQKRNRRRD